MEKDNIVYSTAVGKIKKEKEPEKIIKGDGVVRLLLDKKGRKGKGMIIVTGLDLPRNELKKLASELKKALGCGGAVNQHNIEIQGDDRDSIRLFLEKKQFVVKYSGG